MTVSLSTLAFIRGRRVILRPLLDGDFNRDYLGWLNCPEVNRFSQRRPHPVGWDAMTRYTRQLQDAPATGFNLAIVAREGDRHIGSISLTRIQPVHRCADLSILIGDQGCWNRGFATESIYLLTKHAFEEMNLHKLLVGSFNPAFIHCVEHKLGWTREGTFREQIWSDGRYHSQVWLSMLRCEFKPIELYEEVAE